MKLRLDPLGVLNWQEGNPLVCSISFGGGGGSKSSSKSGVRYNTGFLNPFYTDFPLPVYSNTQTGVTVSSPNATPQTVDFSNIDWSQIPKDEGGNPDLAQIDWANIPTIGVGSGTEGKVKEKGGTVIPGFGSQQFTVGLPQWQGLENLPEFVPFNPADYPTVSGKLEGLLPSDLPQFKGLTPEDYGKFGDIMGSVGSYRQSLYDLAKANLEPDYNKARARTREELSQSGLLTSPVAYAGGGALDVLDTNYMSQLEKASEAANLGAQQMAENQAARYQQWQENQLATKQAELGRELTAAERLAALKQSDLAFQQSELNRVYGEQAGVAQMKAAELARAFESGLKLTEIQRAELARKTGFSMDVIKLIETIMQSRANTALESGKFGMSSSSSAPSFGFELFGNPFASTTPSSNNPLR